MKDIQVSGLHYDRSVNKTFAVVRTSGFTTTFYVSGEVSAADFARWIEPTVERMLAELAA